MAKRQKLTNSSDETNLASLLSTDSVFTIPYFQRPYKWKPERLQQLERDLLQLVDGASDNHFLGAVIIHGRASNPADPRVYEVIDGQQRITTVFLYLCAIIRTLCRNELHDEAAALFLKYIVINRQISLMSNCKLQSSKDDRAQLNAVLEDLLRDSKFISKLSGYTLKPLPATGSNTGRLWKNYKAALKFLNLQVKLETTDRLRAIYTCLLDQVSVVQIDVFDPINGPKIFDSLNSRQEPMTTGDLVRNEIFSRVADQNPAEVDQLDHTHWQPFYQKFTDATSDTSFFDGYFFPFGLIKNPNLKKSEVYSHLRSQWSTEQNPAVIIADLATFQDAFLDLVNGTNRSHLPPSMATAVQRLSKVTPNSTYPFLMRLIVAVQTGQVREEDGVASCDVIESFLVRRAICGHEPTGLHAVFKRLWDDCQQAPQRQPLIDAIENHKTVVWPSSADVKSSVLTRPLYGSSITNFLLCEWNSSFGGDVPTTKPWIEHILPTSLSPSWRIDFTDEQHDRYKDLLANLIPLSQPMNQSLGNSSYSIKRDKYLEDSIFKGTRKLANQNALWRPEHIESRSVELSEWILNRWAY